MCPDRYMVHPYSQLSQQCMHRIAHPTCSEWPGTNLRLSRRQVGGSPSPEASSDRTRRIQPIAREDSIPPNASRPGSSGRRARRPPSCPGAPGRVSSEIDLDSRGKTGPCRRDAEVASCGDRPRGPTQLSPTTRPPGCDQHDGGVRRSRMATALWHEGLVATSTRDPKKFERPWSRLPSVDLAGWPGQLVVPVAKRQEVSRARRPGRPPTGPSHNTRPNSTANPRASRRARPSPGSGGCRPASPPIFRSVNRLKS